MSESWFIRTPEGQVSGPFTTAQMQALAQQGALPPTQQVLETEARIWQAPQAYSVLFPGEPPVVSPAPVAGEKPETGQPAKKRASKGTWWERAVTETGRILMVLGFIVACAWWRGKPLPWFQSSRSTTPYSAPSNGPDAAPFLPTFRPTDESLRKGLVGTWEESMVDANGIQVHVLLTLRSDGSGSSHVQKFLFGEKQAATLLGTWTVRNQELIFQVAESSQPEAVPVGPRVLGRILSVNAAQCRYQDVETNEILVVNRVADPLLRGR